MRDCVEYHTSQSKRNSFGGNKELSEQFTLVAGSIVQVDSELAEQLRRNKDVETLGKTLLQVNCAQQDPGLI